MPGKIWSKHYRITTYADHLDGSLHARVDFTDPMGDTREDERIVYAAMENAKRYLRNELKARQSAPLARTYYEVTTNKIDHMDCLWSITIGEK
jgi:ribosome-binding factor A